MKKSSNKYLKSNHIIEENEIKFDDEVIIESNEINAYISSANIDLEKKFNLKYEEDSYYDIYLNYNYLNRKVYLEIVKVKDDDRQYYKYIPNDIEKNSLIKKLDEYLIKTHKINLEEFIEEIME